MTLDRRTVLEAEPWPHQVAAAQAHARGVRWLLKLWHRKAGKDLSELLFGVLPRAYREPGMYFHCYPEQQQFRTAFWDGQGVDGRRYLDMIPKDMIIGKPNETEMQIELRTCVPGMSSFYKGVGADRLGWLGANPRGVVMSEYQQQDPRALQLLTPILMANGGWASFAYTPWGQNHGYTLFEAAKAHADWFCQRLTVLDTRKPDGTRIVTDADIQFERDVFKKKEAIIQQEYFCSFDSDLEHAVFGALLNQAKADGRVRVFDVVPGYEVVPCFDIGHRDATACGWFQQVGEEHRLVRYEEQTGTTVDYWAERLKVVRTEHKYLYRYVNGKIYAIAPFDAEQKHWALSAKEQAMRLGVYFSIVEKMSEAVQVSRARRFFPRLWIHATEAERFVEICKSFSYEWDEDRKTYSDSTVHDWASHGAKMYCYYACAQTDAPQYQPALVAASRFDPWAPTVDALTEFNPYGVF